MVDEVEIETLDPGYDIDDDEIAGVNVSRGDHNFSLGEINVAIPPEIEEEFNGVVDEINNLSCSDEGFVEEHEESVRRRATYWRDVINLSLQMAGIEYSIDFQVESDKVLLLIPEKAVERREKGPSDYKASKTVGMNN